MKRLIQRVAALTAALCVAAACVAPVYAETANTEKEENVYVSLAGDGSVADIYIVNMFALDGKTEIRDYGAYSSVRNLTSEADISLDGDSVTVSAGAGYVLLSREPGRMRSFLGISLLPICWMEKTSQPMSLPGPTDIW